MTVTIKLTEFESAVVRSVLENALAGWEDGGKRAAAVERAVRKITEARRSAPGAEEGR
jgi:hypothetical protein